MAPEILPCIGVGAVAETLFADALLAEAVGPELFEPFPPENAEAIPPTTSRARTTVRIGCLRNQFLCGLAGLAGAGGRGAESAPAAAGGGGNGRGREATTVGAGAEVALTGRPQFGQAAASVETLCPQSSQVVSATFLTIGRRLIVDKQPIG
jgi:hypothetical protein